MTTILNAERLAKAESHAADLRRALAAQPDAPEPLILLAHTDVPDLIAEVKRLGTELEKYVGWEPTVKEEYEHACGQFAAVEGVLEQLRSAAAGTMYPAYRDACLDAVALLDAALEGGA